MIISNHHNRKEQRPNDACAYDARTLREAISNNSVERYTEIDIFRDILNWHHRAIKREALITIFASREYCTVNCASELFNRVRPHLLKEDVIQPEHGYYILAKYYNN